MNKVKVTLSELFDLFLFSDIFLENKDETFFFPLAKESLDDAGPLLAAEI